MGFIQKVANRRRLPFPSATRRPLSHLIELSSNVAERQSGICDGDRCHQLHQVILWGAARRSGKQAGLGKLLADHAMDGSAQPFHRPVMAAAIEDAHDIVPAVLRPELPHGWKPSLCRRNQFVEINFLACFRHRPDRFRTPFPKTGIPRKFSARFRRLDSGFGAFGNESSFELRDRAQHLKGEHALWRRGIDWISNRAKMDAAFLKILDYLQKMADRPGEAVEPDNDENVAGGKLAEQSRENRPSA